MFNIEYLQNLIFRKQKGFQVIQKSNVFSFADREFYADQKCRNVYFPS
jgi:hypothetical protein